MRGGEDGSDHGSRGSFAVGSGDSDSVFQAHQLREHFCAWNHGNLSVVRFDDFWIVRLHSRRSYDDVSAVGVRSCVVFVNRCASLLVAGTTIREIDVTAGYVIT